jgi:isopenicillin-N N-acyltransferase-like protein
MLMSNYVALVAILLSAASGASETWGTSCSGTNNSIPIWTAAPTFVSSVPNGKLYTAGSGNDTFAVLHLWGTPYQQGFAQGTLLKSVVQQLPGMLTSYIEEIAAKKVPWLPAAIIDLVVEFGAPYLLQMTWNNTKAYAPQRYIDEMQGIADAAGLDVKDIQNFNMFPEMTKAACTIVGATNKSTPSGTIHHLRALDFSVDCPMKNYPQVTVYHDPAGPVTVNVGWTGMIGVLTGISNTTLGIGEKVWINHPKGADGVVGEPWMFILRDALGAPDMGAALSIMQNAKRTCAIHVGIGDSTTNTFHGIEMAANDFNVYSDTSLEWPGHPLIPGVFYWDKHAQPSSDPCLGDLLQQYYGRLDAQTLAVNVAATFKTGDFHAVTFDYDGKLAYVANAQKTYVTEGHLNAYNRQFTQLDLAALFAEQQ